LAPDPNTPCLKANAASGDPALLRFAGLRVPLTVGSSSDILVQSAIPFILMRCEDIASNTDFRHLSTVQDIVVDLRYASVDNFIGRDLYGLLDCAWLHHLAAAGLDRAVTLLGREAPGHRVLVLDALRPHRVQIQLWDHLEGTDLRQYVADPSLGSIHSFGMALDATLIDPQGRELDMGTGFDEMTELSHPQLEAKHLATGALMPAQHRNRELLRGVLSHSGFQGIKNEWWHFEMLDRQHVRQHFTRVD
jgi:zinc D-Ala-D-Ala dipeptidase